MQKIDKIYEGKAKILYSTENPNLLVQYFKDDATAFNAQKKAVIEGKGVLNNVISEFIMLKLAQENIPTHFVK
jgi:phosphoribosylaminoimidazole-succinocarboxamide synthase